jgi:hypothetical protein
MSTRRSKITEKSGMSLNVIVCTDLPQNADWTGLCKLSVAIGNSREHSHRIPWAQGVVGSNPIAPTILSVSVPET